MDFQFYLDFLSPILTPLLTILSVYLLYSQGFMKQKGKNLATKQDIGKITDEIEKVKQAYTAENEFLKTKLELLSTNHQEQNKDIKDAAFSFFDAYVKWNYSLILDISKFNQHNFEYLSQQQSVIADNYTDVMIKKERFLLLAPHEKLEELMHNLINATADFEVDLVVALISLHGECTVIELDRKANPHDIVKLTTKYHDFLSTTQQEVHKKNLEHIKKYRPIFTELSFELKNFLKELNSSQYIEKEFVAK